MALLSLIALCVLAGAWCPQEAQVGISKVIEQFGEPGAVILQRMGIADIFHSPLFLCLIGLLTLNMIACSTRRVFSALRACTGRPHYLDEHEISKLPIGSRAELSCSGEQAIKHFADCLKKEGYKVEAESNRLKAEWAKTSLVASSVCHAGLLLLLAGITITSLTGFSGFKMAKPGSSFDFASSEHSKLWTGRLPRWSLRVDGTRKEDYTNGEPRQWYSKLSVIGENGTVLKQQEISVNNPLSYDGVDIYQSSWGLSGIKVSFDGRPTQLPLEPMGSTHLALMPVDSRTMLIFSLHAQGAPLRVFAKIPSWEDPKLLAEIPQGKSEMFGTLKVGYIEPVPVTGLQYKSDPGLPVTYLAFIVIICGAFLAAVPYRLVFATAADLQPGACRFVSGGQSRRARRELSTFLQKLTAKLSEKFSGYAGAIDMNQAQVDQAAAAQPVESNAPVGVANETEIAKFPLN